MRHSCQVAHLEYLPQHFMITLVRCSETSCPLGICAGFESQWICSGKSLGA